MSLDRVGQTNHRSTACAGGAVRTCLWAGLVISGAWYGWRACRRALTDGHDLAMLWAGGRAWVHGRNPYHFEDLIQAAKDGGYIVKASLGELDFLSLYPPPFYAGFSLLGLLPWSAALWVWLLINVGATVLLIVGLTRWLSTMNDQIGRPTRYDLWMWLAIPVLLWSPIHVGVSRGNVSVVYTALVVLALGPAGRSWIKSSAIGVTTAGMVKPQLGLPFTLAWLFLERGRTWGVVMVTATIAGVIPLLMTQLMQPTWTDDYIRIITRFTVDGTGNPKPDYWWSYTMIDLLPVLHLWIDSRWVAKLAAALIVGLAGLAWLGAWRRAGRSRVAEDWAWRLAAVSAVSIMMLLVTYHRTYDATFMLLPLAWSCWRLTVRETSRSSRRLAMIVAMTSGTFVLPCSAILARAIDQGHLQRAWFEIPLIRAMTLHHQTILLVLILVLLLIDMWRSPLLSVTPTCWAAAKSPGTEAAA